MRPVTRLGRFICMSLIIGFPASSATAAYLPKIIPGEAMGPVHLGMAERAAQVAVHRLGAEFGCDVDIAVSEGRVVAIGTRDGGCLGLPLPPNLARRDTDGGPKVPPVAFGIGGPVAALLYAFGQPIRVVRFRADEAAVVWRQGLIACAGSMSLPTGGIVTYLAVVPSGTAILPALPFVARPRRNPDRQTAMVLLASHSYSEPYATPR